jgi:SAM-dependent methyltransferase
VFIEHKDIPKLLYLWPTLATREYYIRTEGQCHTFSALKQARFYFMGALLELPMAQAVQKFIAVSKEFGGWCPNETNGANYGNKLLGLYQDMKENGIREPIALLEGPPGGTGRLILQEGNHRAVIAHYLGRGLEATVRNSKLSMIGEWSRPPEKRLHLYQSIFVNGEELVAGARRDGLERMNCVRPEDLAGKSVLVLGCNNGRDCFLAGERGATKIVGVDIDAPLLNAALREATYYGYPTDFIQYDLNSPLDIGEFDTVLAFSIYNSVADHGILAQTMRKGKVVYFEGHVLLPMLSEAEYRQRYAGAIGSFRNVEPVYSVDGGIRRMYRMER